MNRSTDELQELRDFALAVAVRAGERTLRYFRGEYEVELKADETPVTRADREAEELIRESIAAAYPADAVLGEELGYAAGTSGRTWVIDPIDGTKSFVAGVPLYAVLIALVEGDYRKGPLPGSAVRVGVIHVPALEESVAAARGLGAAWHRGGGPGGEPRVGMQPAKVSDVREPSRARVTTSDFADLHRREPVLAGWLDQTSPYGRTWGDAYGYLLVATGRMEAMIDPVISPWDIAPMPVIIEEAGGRYTDLAGEPALGTSGIATNGRLHQAFLEARDHG